MKYYLYFLDISQDSLIMNMKKKSYERYWSNPSDSEYDKNAGDRAKAEESDDKEGDGYSDSDDEDKELKYKNVDIADDIYIE